jgi:hypothetical protein
MQRNQLIEERRNELTRSVQTAKDNARGSFSFVAPYFVISVLSHLVNEAKPHMANLVKGKTWATFNENVFLRSAFLTKWLKWGGIIGMIGTSISGILYKLDEKKAQEELKKIDSFKLNSETENTPVLILSSEDKLQKSIQNNPDPLKVENPSHIISPNSLQIFGNIMPLPEGSAKLL